ncbi:DUF779 domain-containing protein [Oerskovia turbata]|uniref:DUF779 domain-containing protein n=1 Tax=Oerskovia turbata TaxID=1713 RepID=A0A4Q1KRR7_9CELL|nr:DUF779 domain-containing protein [Oerskovia turbata]RXR25322.1 DUF779 domain-containing protein [Oerskovia turbata]RXR32737.1 DUF779 domain-containing protein [Oerskovia turbata]TGJ95586.1 DUF779 domain-containing protein [Actinotalea fermentans ATCC 43279 = JCM 9966 = DSM 3133]
MPDDVTPGPQVAAPGAGASSPGEVRPERVGLTPAAAELLARLRIQYGELMFHQSGGCCDGSSPMCYPQGEFLTSDADVYLGDLVVVDPEEPTFTVPFWMSRSQFEYWSHTHLTVDVVPGRGSGFSVEAPEGVRFIIRSRLFSDEESAGLAGQVL